MSTPTPEEAASDRSLIPKRKPGFRGSGARLGLAAVLVVVAAILYWRFQEQLTLQNLAQYEAWFRQQREERPWLVYTTAFFVYVVVAGLSLPGATAMTLVIGWLLGFWRALLLVSFASTTGASVAFLLSRYLLRDPLRERFGDRMHAFNERLARDGAFYLFTLRLIPIVPFFVINLVMGLTPLRLWTYWWVSQVGMLPGTAAYVYAGSVVPSLNELARQGLKGIVRIELLVAFAVLGLLPLVLKKLLDRFGVNVSRDERPPPSDGEVSSTTRP